MKKVLLPMICVLFFAACKKDSTGTSNNQPKIAPTGFNFATTKKVPVSLVFRAPNDDALKGILVRFYNPNDTSAKTHALFTAITDQNGELKATVTVPTYVTHLIIDPQSYGILRYANVAITGGAVTALIGGKAGYGGDVVAPTLDNISSLQRNLSLSHRSGSASTLTVSGSTDFEYPSPYTSANAILNTTQYPLAAGRAVYMNTYAPLDATTISYVNSTLPEGSKLPQSHPQYFAAGIVNTINVVQSGAVTLTFVTGITSNKNTLAYYTYPTNSPPQSLSDIKNATYVFPNATNQFGNPALLQPGDNITLGTFSAGTSIGFMLMVNAWQSSGSVNVNAVKWYSQDALNADKARHSIVAYDNVHNSYYIGFEDADTRQSYCDFDYNDCVFFATSTPGTAITNSGVPPITKPVDSDGDGVPDSVDAFPNDPTKAYINYYPSQNGYAQLAYEDNWPLKGDYDLNDVVVNYRYTYISNAQNQVVSMQGDYSVAAAGTVFKDGFAVQLPIAASAIQSVTGQQQISNYIKFASNGVEAGQSKAVIVPFDNYNALLNTSYGSLINTIQSQPNVASTTASVLVTFTSPVDPTLVAPTALNPFIITKLTRGNEVHLPGYQPTDLANKALFGTGDDVTNLATGITYVSSQNWPWAMNFSGAFAYPTENTVISKAYPHFLDWAQSGGSSFTDWYSNLGPGYRNASYIYVP